MHARKSSQRVKEALWLQLQASNAKKLRLLGQQGMSLTDNQRKNMPPTVYETYPMLDLMPG